MIRSHSALLRHAQDFFAAELVGLYRWDRVTIAEPERMPAIPSNAEYRDRRRMMEEREGRGKYLEQVRILFKPWEILVYSSMERPPLGEVLLRDFDSTQTLVEGPLDSATWSKIGNWIRSHQQRIAS